jgi:hypothetical protein
MRYAFLILTNRKVVSLHTPLYPALWDSSMLLLGTESIYGWELGPILESRARSPT